MKKPEPIRLSQLHTALFLKKFKQLILDGQLYFVNRKAHQEALIELGLTNEGCKEVMLELTIENYCQGPNQDHDRRGEVWVFGQDIENREVYIKLKIAKVDDVEIAKCISFHRAKYPLCYPHK